MTPRLFLVDGHSHCYRAYYALQNMTGPDGAPTNMVYGFINMLRRALREGSPDYVAVAFDRRGPTFRHEIFPEYKANRKPAPEDFHRQVPLVRDALAAHGIPCFDLEGFEADDVMGALARQAADAGVATWLLTSDKDAEQLLGPLVSMLDITKGREVTVETLAEEKGIRPDQVPDEMALSGDPVDNVPGVPKVGPKTALRLIREYGSLEATLAAAQGMKKSKLRENLIESAAAARLSLRLVTIDVNAPVALDLEACRVREPDEERLRELFERLGFRRFLDEMVSAPTREEKDYRLVNTAEAFELFLAELRKQRRISVDVETTSTHPVEAELVGMSVSWAARTGYYLAFRAPEGTPTLDRRGALEALRPTLEDEGVAKIGQNLKYDQIVLRGNGVDLRGIAFDTMLAAYVLDASARNFGLDDLALSLLQHRCIPISDLIGKGPKQITMDQVPLEQVVEYACEDADIAWRLAEVLEPRVRESTFVSLYRDIELPLIRVLADMEICGVRLDADRLIEMSGWLARRVEELEERIETEAGVRFNPGSTKQLAQVLFEDLGLPVVRRTKTGVSTDAEVLQQLVSVHPVPGLVLEYRSALKLKNTYVDALPGMVYGPTGKIHTSFSQVATATGRLSSSQPNLQNIPIRTEAGNRIRRAFVPSEEGWLFLSADYSQIELRILAHLSRDEALVRAFQNDEDIHRFVASQVFGVAADQVTDGQRRAAKAVNFGIVYGLTAYGLSRDLGVPVKEADEFIRAYFERHPGVRDFIEETLEFARANNYVETLRGRRRRIPDIAARDRSRRTFAERAAVNTVVQGSAADMMKIAMVRIHRRLPDSGLRGSMLLQIHDELLFETPPEEKIALAELATGEMVAAMALDVPVKVNVAFGANWGEAK